MRRLALICLALAALGGSWLVAAAGADDTHSYSVELDNAFGIVEGSDIRVAGVNVGQVTELDVNAAKRAVVSFETSGTLGELGEDTTCSSEPQSLIAEYFLDCVPEGPPLPEGGQIPVEQTTQTVQPDLVQNTLREPFKRRLTLLINEFGTALAGNPATLNAAIRRGAPSLRELEAVLEILAEHNRIIRQLNEDSDVIMARLAERREDVVRFVQEARDTAEASAARRADLSRNFEILDDFLAELRPTLAELEGLAAEQTPLLVDLRAAAPQLNRLAVQLPAFNEATEASLSTLGDAAIIGRRALRRGEDEIEQLRATGRDAPAASTELAKLLVDLDDRDRAVLPDPRSPGGRGFTGFENLLNYFYYQVGAINQYDEIGHLLHVGLYEPESPCADYTTGVEGIPARGGGLTRDPAERHRCVSWSGPTQPGITVPSNLPPYDPSVCPDGSTRPDLCQPRGSEAAVAAADESGARDGRGGGDSAARPGPGPAPATPGSAPDSAEGGQPQPPLGPEDVLGLPDGVQLPDLGQLPGPGGSGGGGGDAAMESLLDFLFAP
jgi:virulence factor Mce-like protein